MNNRYEMRFAGSGGQGVILASVIIAEAAVISGINNTPTIIRFPFEKLAREHENISLIRLSRSKAMVPASLGDRAVGINADMAKSIEDIAKSLH